MSDTQVGRITFATVNNPAAWDIGDSSYLTFGSPTEAKRAEELFTDMQRELAAKSEECERLRKDAERYRWLREWLVQSRLLTALTCKPSCVAPNGDYWILRYPAAINGDSCVGYGKTDDAAIDAAREGK